MKTELITGFKHTIVEGKPMVIVTTESGNQVWVAKSQFNEQAETITYQPMKAGDTFVAKRDSTRLHPEGHPNAGQPVYLKGQTVALKSARNEFRSFGRQAVKKYSSIEVLDHIIGKGITPTFSLATA